MAGLFHVQSSPAGEQSASIGAGRCFTDSWTESNPNRPTTTLNLWTASLPELAGPVLAARAEIEAGRRPVGDAAEAWAGLESLAGDLLSADRLLISAPMWNFGLPYRLKHYIDCVTQPTLTYRGSPSDGFQGLVPGTPAALILTRGGSYPAGTDREPLDFQRRYLVAWLAFLGFRLVEAILVEPTTGDPEAVARGEARCRAVAGRF